MTYIFLDESGDLGLNFNNKSVSRYFVIAILVTSSPNSIEKIIKKMSQQLFNSGRKIPPNFHAYNDSDFIRKYILKNIAEREAKIYTLILDKQKTSKPNHQTELYNSMVKGLIYKVIEHHQGNFILTASKRDTKKAYNEIFLNEVLSIAKQKGVSIETRLIQHFTDKCLQVVDFISWAIFRKWEQNDTEFYNLIAPKIIFEESVRL